MSAVIHTSNTYDHFAKRWGIPRKQAKMRILFILYGFEQGIADPDRDEVMRHIRDANHKIYEDVD